MLKSRTLLFYICISISLVLFNGTTKARAQNLQPVYDGRIEARASMPTNSEVQLIRRLALPRARRAWRGSETCSESFEAVGVANGFFTKTNVAQRAVLYRFCVTGHNFAKDGIVVIEDGSIEAHVTIDGGENFSIEALGDINNNGLSEIVIVNGATNQGYTAVVAILIEISQSGVKKFGIADIYEDNCGTLDQCKMTGYKLLVRSGARPIFFRQAYRKRNERWIKAGNSMPYSLRDDEIEYRLLN